MNTISFHTTSPEETEALGERIGRALEPETVIALFGPLGAGKTTLTKGIARGLDVPDLVHSPTFTLIHEHEGRVRVNHIDLYRLDASELADLGYEEYIYGPGVTIIEWAERAGSLLPDDRLEVRIGGRDDDRMIEVVATGRWSEEVLGRIE